MVSDFGNDLLRILLKIYLVRVPHITNIAERFYGDLFPIL